jgi:4-hydroxyphenylacetate decarboxylase small subunit
MKKFDPKIFPMMAEMVQKNKLQHNDCRNYCNMDITRGICRRTGSIVPSDEDSCSDYVPLPKCKFCSNYAPGDQPGLGSCNAEASQPWATPEMIAVTCGMFRSAQAG